MGRSEPKEEPTHCSRCGSPLLRLRWSSTADVLVCDVFTCERYRRPIPIPRRDITLAEELASLARKTKLRGSGKKLKIIPEEDFHDYEEEPNPVIEDLRRMRRAISSEEEDSEVL